MITFDLACERGHRFEGWFRNREDFEEQLAADLVVCPLCGSARVEKQLSAVSVHVGRRAATQPAAQEAAKPAPDTPGEGSGPAQAAAGQGRAFMQALSYFIETHFEDVGSRFAEEARKADSGETETRNIRGTTTPEEEAELKEEGVEFFKIAMPKYDA